MKMFSWQSSFNYDDYFFYFFILKHSLFEMQPTDIYMLSKRLIFFSCMHGALDSTNRRPLLKHSISFIFMYRNTHHLHWYYIKRIAKIKSHLLEEMMTLLTLANHHFGTQLKLDSPSHYLCDPKVNMNNTNLKLTQQKQI